MKLLTIDFETYYDKDIGFAKQTTEEYLRDPQFEVIGVAVKVDDEGTSWASGTHEEIKGFLSGYDWANSTALAHNAMFDGAILSWHFGIKPKFWLDTLCMGRAINGVEVGGSLKALAERYEVGVKGNEVDNAKGKRRLDFTSDQLSRYGDYCVNDVELTYKILHLMLANKFPKKELHLIDATLRMFTEPTLDLDLLLLEQHLMEVRDRKDKLLLSVGLSEKTGLMSNPKFAQMLQSFGVIPPTKISLATGKETWAFAKADEGFKTLLEHDNLDVQALVAARLGVRSTLEESRTERFISIANRGLMPVPLKYYAAHTGRWGGLDKINLQNLPSRGENANALKRSIIAPTGYVLIDCDSSQIEARVLAWFAGQEDLVESFKKKEDVYSIMASKIYSKPPEEITKSERFLGKTVILGAGYGVGAIKFRVLMKQAGVELDIEGCRRIIATYRESNYEVVKLWKEAQTALTALSQGAYTAFGRAGVIELVPEEHALRLPNGLLMRYDNLAGEQGEKGFQYSYKTRQGRVNIYGGKVVENVCQALARIIIGEQMLRISKQFKPVMTVHDSVICTAPEKGALEAQAYVEECMRWVPAWAEGLPLNCESGVGKSYGEC